MANQKLTRILIAMAALLAPVTAFATINPVGQTAWTLWAFGNGNVIYNLLYAASGLVSSSGYLALVSFLSLISVVAASVMAANNAMASKRLIAAILGIFAFISIGLKETANVAVDDPVTNYINVVPNVPALVAIPPAVISEAGYRMTQLLEQYYSLPNDLTLTGGDAFDLANSLINAQTQVQVTSPGLRATVAAFTTNCILPALASGQLNAGQLVDSTALWSMDGQQGTLAQAEQSPFTPVYTGSSPGGTLVPCGPGGVGTGPWYPTVTSTEYPSVSADNAYQYISQYFTAAAPDWLANTASTFANTSTYSWLGSELTSAEQWDFGTNLTQSTGETIAQAAAVNLMNPSMRAAAVASGDSSLVTSLAVSQGQQSQISSWATAAALFRDLSGYIFSVLQAFILGIAPIILAVVVLPGAGKRILLSYGQVLIWLALWEPTMSVINFIVALYAQGTLGPTLGSSGGYSMMNQGVITQMTSNMELAAGFLASTVPLITWGLVKGGLAFTDFVVGAVGSSFATTAGAMAATGNVSLGNFSMGNETLNQRMLAARTTGGQGQFMEDVSGEGITTTYNTGGSVTNSVYGKETALKSANTSAAVANALSAARSAGVQASQDTSSGLSMASAAISQIMTSASHGQGINQSTSVGNTASLGRSGTARVQEAIGAGLDHLTTDAQAKEFGYGLGGKLTAGQRKSLGSALSEEEGKATGHAKSMLGSLLGGLNASATGGMDSGVDEKNSYSTSGKQSHTASLDVSGGTSADLKKSAAVNAATAATLGYLQSDQHGYSADARKSIASGLKFTQSASNEYRANKSFTASASVGTSLTIANQRDASSMEPNNLAALRQAAKQHIAHREAGIDRTVNPKIGAGGKLLAQSGSMAKKVGALATSDTAGVPGHGAIVAEAEAKIGDTKTDVAARSQQLSNLADGRGKAATIEADADRNAGHDALDNLQERVAARGGRIQDALNSNDPMDLAAPRGLRGPWDLAGGGILAIGEAGAANVALHGAGAGIGYAAVSDAAPLLVAGGAGAVGLLYSPNLGKAELPVPSNIKPLNREQAEAWMDQDKQSTGSD